MRRTLSLSPRTHLFIKDGALFIKLQKPNKVRLSQPDYYIIKKLSMNDLKKIHEFAGQILKENKEAADVKTD